MPILYEMKVPVVIPVENIVPLLARFHRPKWVGDHGVEDRASADIEMPADFDICRSSILNSMSPTHFLDDGIWPEEAQYFPRGLLPGPSFHIVLASDSGYYFHRMDEAALYQVGNTLEEVFEGLKYCKYSGPAGPNSDEWGGVDPCTDFFEPSQYFPNYKFDREKGHWVLGL